MAVETQLLRSLDRQRRLLDASIVLTPVDSVLSSQVVRERTAFAHGLYLSDKVRDRPSQLDAAIQFPRRSAAARDAELVHNLFAERLGAAAGSLRLLSGLHAHATTFMSIGSAGDSIMILPEVAGGHGSTHRIMARLGFRVLEFPVDLHSLAIDRRASLAVIAAERPDFVFVDRSEGLRYEDFAFVGSLPTPAPVTVFDASQYLSQIIAETYPNPLGWGFDLMLFSLHKSFPGPQKAGIVAREVGPLWDRLLSGLSTFVSSTHGESTYLAGLTLADLGAIRAHARRMVDLASTLEAHLAERGVPVIPVASQGDIGWPRTQHLWISAPDQETAFSWYEQLARVRIHCNYRKLPYRLGHGLRLGTSHISSRGFGVAHMPTLASLIAATLTTGATPRARHAVAQLAMSALLTGSDDVRGSVPR